MMEEVWCSVKMQEKEKAKKKRYVAKYYSCIENYRSLSRRA